MMAAFRVMHVSPAKDSYICMRDYQESMNGETDGRTDRQTDAGQSDPYVPLCFAGDPMTHILLYLESVKPASTRICYSLAKSAKNKLKPKGMV